MKSYISLIKDKEILEILDKCGLELIEPFVNHLNKIIEPLDRSEYGVLARCRYKEGSKNKNKLEDLLKFAKDVPEFEPLIHTAIYTNINQYANNNQIVYFNDFFVHRLSDDVLFSDGSVNELDQNLNDEFWAVMNKKLKTLNLEKAYQKDYQKHLDELFSTNENVEDEVTNEVEDENNLVL